MADFSLWIALAACALTCYVAACNVALKSFNRAKLSDLLESRGQADRLELFTERGDKLLLMTGTLRTITNLAIVLAVFHFLSHHLPAPSTDLPAGSGGPGFWARWHHPLLYLLAFVISALVISVFGVSIASSIGLHMPEGLLARSSSLLSVGLKVFQPLVNALHLLDPVIRKIAGVDVEGQAEKPVSDEVLSVVEEHEDSGEVDPAQKQMIEAVFELPTTTAGEIMTPRTEIQAIDVASSLREVGEAVTSAGHSRIPVYDGTIDNIVGILYAKDLIPFLGTDGQFELRKVLRDALMVPESKPVRDLLAEFKGRKVHIALVLDEFGGTAGLVTIEDIIEELVGEIHDEYEPAPESEEMRRIDDKTFDVDARVHVEELADLGLTLPEERDYDTVGGFVFATLGHIPNIGEQFEVDGLKFTVTDAQRNRVNKVRIEKLEPAPAPGSEEATRRE